MPGPRNKRSRGAQSATPADVGHRRLWLLGALLVTIGLAVYANSFLAPLVFDGEEYVGNNPKLRTLWPPSVPMSGNSRPVVYLTFAANYVWGAGSIPGFHLVNVTIHVLAGLALWGLVRRTLRWPPLQERYGAAAEPLALITALLWLVHPLQTQAVTYLYQRIESLMALFFLLTLYCFVRAVQAVRGARWWYAASVACCLLSAGCKEVAAMAPLVVLTYDRIFVAPSWREIGARRGGYYAALASCWLLVVWLLVRVAPLLEKAGLVYVENVTPLGYALSQPGVLLHYLRLTVWPAPLCFDYAWPVAKSASQIVPGVLVIGSLLAATFWALWRGSPFGWAGLTFFLVLAPTSTILPIRDLAVEHRMYLPLAAVVAVVVFGIYELARRWAPAGLWPRKLQAALFLASALAVALFGNLTLARNEDYASDLTIWGDTCQKQPANARAQGNFGNALSRAGQDTAALEHLRVALQLHDGALQHYNLAHLLDKQGADGEAAVHYREAIRLEPTAPLAYNNLGTILERQQQVEEARRLYRQAIELDPEYTLPRNNLAQSLTGSGDLQQAVQWYASSLEHDPSDARVHFRLGNILAELKDPRRAEQHYRQSLELDPQMFKAWLNLGRLLAEHGRPREAVRPLTAATALDPNNATAHRLLGEIWLALDRPEQGLEQFEISLRLRPEDPQLRQLVGHVRKQLGKAQ